MDTSDVRTSDRDSGDSYYLFRTDSGRFSLKLKKGIQRENVCLSFITPDAFLQEKKQVIFLSNRLCRVKGKSNPASNSSGNGF